MLRRRFLWSAEFSPLDIAGCKLWLDFSDIDTLYKDAGVTKVTTNGDAIYQANDKSGNNYNATQSTASARPLYTVNQQNGLSVADFNGDKLVLPNTLRASLTTKVTYFAVMNYVTAGQDGFGTRYYVANEFIYYHYNATSYRFVWGQTVATEPSNTCSFGKYFLKAFKWDSANQRVDLYSNGTTSIANGAPAPNYSLAGNATSPLIIGAINSGIQFYCGEILVYTEALGNTDISKIADYLNNKWAIY